MLSLRQYTLASDFLGDCEPTLLKHELENNQVLGFANVLAADETKTRNACMLQVWDEDQLQLCALIRNFKVVLAGPNWNEEVLRLLYTGYEKRGIRPAGVVAEHTLARSFAALYQIKAEPERSLILHELKSIIPQPFAEGKLETATEADLNQLCDWFYEFQSEVRNFPLRNKQELAEDLLRWIRQEDLFKWMLDGEMKSMSAIVRKTKRVAFTGLVYTPAAWRGRGFAGSCVQAMSRLMLERGFGRCGLYTDKANPVSNHIYTKMGYVPSLEFSDIPFSI